MTIDELQRIVISLSNSAWVRWWANFGDARGERPVKMAIQCLDTPPLRQPRNPQRFIAVPVPDLERLGFVRCPFYRKECIYLIDRTNPDGTPYKSQL